MRTPVSPPNLVPVREEDFEDMLVIRIAALRESLERLGRFDPQVARARLSAGFMPQYMHHIEVDGSRAGFVTLRPMPSAETPTLKLEHLYLLPSAQGQGVGSWVLQWAKAQAQSAKSDIALSALQDSDANRFYLRHGFVKTGESDFDIDYRWSTCCGAAA
jgi:GNAT superfamily N-acetyltransferase